MIFVDIVAPEDEQHPVASQAQDVEEDHELDGAEGAKLKSLQDVAEIESQWTSIAPENLFSTFFWCTGTNDRYNLIRDILLIYALSL